MSDHKVQEHLHGWAATKKDAPLELMELPLKKFTDDDIDIKITHCGICGTDIHTIDSGWGNTDYPCVVGHEMAGIAVQVGSNVKHVKPGDRVGVGVQSGSCGSCEECNSGNENVCVGRIATYNSRWPDGTKTMGGYSDYWRGHNKFVFKIPEKMSNEIAATFFCAGVTTYAALKRHNINEKSVVGVIGLGGLGHYGIQWAKAMEAEVWVISRNDKKKADAESLGATGILAMSKGKEELAKYKRKFSHILCTSFSDEQDWDFYLGLLKPFGVFIMVGLPEVRLAGIKPNMLAIGHYSITGSFIGSPSTIEEMLEFAQQKGVKPWINKYPMAKVNEAIKAQREGNSRYRIILEN